MKHFAKLPFVLFIVFAAFVPLHAARAATPTPHPEPSELVRPSSGNDTFKLASLGVVFLIIGAAVVYAPQIVSAITGLPRRVSSPKSKPAKKKPAAAPASKPLVAEEQATRVIDLPQAPPPPMRPPERRVEIPESHDVVSRLQNEIRSAWSKTR